MSQSPFDPNPLPRLVCKANKSERTVLIHVPNVVTGEIRAEMSLSLQRAVDVVLGMERSIVDTEAWMKLRPVAMSHESAGGAPLDMITTAIAMQRAAATAQSEAYGRLMVVRRLLLADAAGKLSCGCDAADRFACCNHRVDGFVLRLADEMHERVVQDSEAPSMTSARDAEAA